MRAVDLTSPAIQRRPAPAMNSIEQRDSYSETSLGSTLRGMLGSRLRNGYGCGNWNKAVCAVRFKFVCTYTDNGPGSGSKACRYVVACRPCCQFNTTSDVLLPGALKRTSK